MPGNVTVEKTGSSTVLLSADSPPVKPVTEHGGVDVISWVVTYQAETDDGVPMGRESRATFSNGGRIQIASSLIKLSTQLGPFVTLCNLETTFDFETSYMRHSFSDVFMKLCEVFDIPRVY